MRQNLDGLCSDDQAYCNQVLSAMAVAYRPVNISELHEILRMPSQVDLRLLVEKRCFAFLETKEDVVFFRHDSAKDFILDGMQDQISRQHFIMLEGCLHSLSRLCVNQSRAGIPEISTNSMAYSIVNWMRHANQTESRQDTRASVTKFLTENILEWVDLVTLTRRISSALVLIRDLEGSLKVCVAQHSPELHTYGSRAMDFRSANRIHFRSKQSTYPEQPNDEGAEYLNLISEAHRMLRFHQSISGQSVAQAKHTLIFCPESSIIKQQLLSRQFPELEVWPTMEPQWGGSVQILRGHDDYVRSVAYSHDGGLLASASDDRSVMIWNTTTGTAQHAFHQFKGWVEKVSFSPSGLLAATDGTSIKVWDTNTGNVEAGSLERAVPDYTDGASLQVNDIAFSADGNMLAAGVYDSIIVWEMPSFACRAWDTTSGVLFLKFSKDGKVLVSASDGTISIWRSEDGQRLRTVLYSGGLTAFDLSSDARLVAIVTDQDGDLAVWDTTSDNTQVVLEGHQRAGQAIAFSPDNKLISIAAEYGAVKIWKAPWVDASRGPEHVLKGQAQRVLSLSFSPQQRYLASSSTDGSVRVWEYAQSHFQNDEEIEKATARERRNKAQPHDDDVLSITVSHNGKLVATASSDWRICLWESSTGILLRTLTGHENTVCSVQFSPDDQSLVSASFDRTCRVWSTTTESKPRILRGHRDWVRHAAFSHDSRFVASGSDDETVRVWDMDYEDVDQQNDAGSSKTRKESESSGTIDDLEVLDMEKGIQVLHGHRDYVTSVAFSTSDGNFLAAGGDDGEVLVWELQNDPVRGFSHDFRRMKLESPSDKKIKNKGSPRRRVLALQFLDRKKRLIASFPDHVLVWDLNTCELLNVARMNGFNHFDTMRIDPAFPEYVVTDEGPVAVDDLLSARVIDTKPTPWCPYKMSYPASEKSEFGYWITRDGEKILHVPGKYYSSAICIYDRTVVLGGYDGRVLFFKFRQT